MRAGPRRARLRERAGLSRHDVTLVDRTTFNRRLGSEIVGSPQNVAGIAWLGHSSGWAVCGDSMATGSQRLPFVLGHLDRALVGTEQVEPFWLLCCLWDGWRERTGYSTDYRWVDPPDNVSSQVEWQGPPGVLPRLSATRDWIACFSAHHGDPSAVLLPEVHYLNNWYRTLRARTEAARRPWHTRAARASYAGADHHNATSSADGPQLRRALKALVAREGLPVDVWLGQPTARRTQLRNKYLIDIDGFVRTWDAWAWKMLSGSVVLSPVSNWETRFTRQFEPWKHFVPLAADISDLADRLAWCQANDERCREIARLSRRRAIEVYNHHTVERETQRLLRPMLYG